MAQALRKQRCIVWPKKYVKPWDFQISCKLKS
ncbi:hypothetical protein PC110_g7147 [Phytophthora cactorum]|uniref:Uncharacterized protein n=1 Tax=Phytophthora cactorum TaxID=29920 RepID=A0A329SIK8_9STRA|nr:hypothetical protein PC110_g7147 [Phytophthora cactorum]